MILLSSSGCFYLRARAHIETHRHIHTHLHLHTNTYWNWANSTKNRKRKVTRWIKDEEHFLSSYMVLYRDTTAAPKKQTCFKGPSSSCETVQVEAVQLRSKYTQICMSWKAFSTVGWRWKQCNAGCIRSDSANTSGQSGGKEENCHQHFLLLQLLSWFITAELCGIPWRWTTSSRPPSLQYTFI